MFKNQLFDVEFTRLPQQAVETFTSFNFNWILFFHELCCLRSEPGVLWEVLFFPVQREVQIYFVTWLYGREPP